MWPFSHCKLVKSRAAVHQNGTPGPGGKILYPKDSVRITRDFSGLSSSERPDGRVIHRPVPFVQHSPGIQHLCLWEAAFTIACVFPSANVSRRRRGASPSRSV